MTQEPQTLTLTVSIEEANLILGALGELPAKHTMALIAKLQGQAQQQLPQPE